jgi:hypothetical protein
MPRTVQPRTMGIIVLSIRNKVEKQADENRSLRSASQCCARRFWLVSSSLRPCRLQTKMPAAASKAPLERLILKVSKRLEISSPPPRLRLKTVRWCRQEPQRSIQTIPSISSRHRPKTRPAAISRLDVDRHSFAIPADHGAGSHRDPVRPSDNIGSAARHGAMPAQSLFLCGPEDRPQIGACQV